MKCSKCGATIKNVYYVDGKPYGVECFKTALGVKRDQQAKEELKKYEDNKAKLRQQRQDEYIKELEDNKSWADVVIEVLRSKKMNSIKNEYKLNLYNEALAFYNEYNSLDNDLISKCRRYLITTAKDNTLFNRMLLESYNDEELINRINDAFLYTYEGIEEELEAKYNYLISKYDYTVEEYRWTKLIKINNITVKTIEIEE